MIFFSVPKYQSTPRWFSRVLEGDQSITEGSDEDNDRDWTQKSDVHQLLSDSDIKDEENIENRKKALGDETVNNCNMNTTCVSQEIDHLLLSSSFSPPCLLRLAFIENDTIQLKVTRSLENDDDNEVEIIEKGDDDYDIEMCTTRRSHHLLEPIYESSFSKDKITNDIKGISTGEIEKDKDSIIFSSLSDTFTFCEFNPLHTRKIKLRTNPKPCVLQKKST